MLPQGYNGSMKIKAETDLAIWSFRCCWTKRQIGRGMALVVVKKLFWVTDSGYERYVSLSLCNGDRREYGWNLSDTPAQLQKLMKTIVSLYWKDPQSQSWSTDLLSESKGNMRSVVEGEVMQTTSSKHPVKSYSCDYHNLYLDLFLAFAMYFK